MPMMPRGPPTEQLDANHLAVRWHRRGPGVRQARSLWWASLRALVRPNAVEQGLVIRDYPALGDPTLLDPKDGDGTPLEDLASTATLARGEDDRSLLVRDHAMNGDSECPVRDLASPEEVA
jgi:hypothetical protein